MNAAEITAFMVALGGIIKVFLDYKATASKTNKVLDDIKIELVSVKQDTSETRKNSVENRTGIKNIHRIELSKAITKAIERGYTSIKETEEILNLYESYHILGGNGAIDSLVDKFKELPIKNESEI